MKTPEQKAKDAERARFRYHNNLESRTRKKEKMRLWASLNKQKIESTPELRAKWNEMARLRLKTPKRMEQKRQAQARYRKKMKALGLYKNKRGNRTVQTQRWLAKPSNRFKKRAHLIVYAAIKNGTLKRVPCEQCGEKAVAHHDDYSKPLDVRWLCPLHHYQHHQGMLK